MTALINGLVNVTELIRTKISTEISQKRTMAANQPMGTKFKICPKPYKLKSYKKRFAVFSRIWDLRVAD